MSEGPSPVPVLIVSGFLGSGKTTLVGHLLDQARQRGLRLAIVSNEFGDTGIDRALLDSGEEGYVELDGGCVCCRLSDALTETVEMVLDRAKPDLLVLETSGVALPGEIVIQFWRPPLRERVRDETIVVVIDGARFSSDEPDETTLAQIEAADLFLLNKCDQIDAADQASCEQRLAEMAPGQPVFRTVRAEIDLDVLVPPDADRTERRDATAPPQPHTHEQFDTSELYFAESLPEDEILRRVLAEAPLRAKGFVQTPEGVKVVQGVGDRITLDEPRVPVQPSLIGRVVLIRRVEGRHSH